MGKTTLTAILLLFATISLSAAPGKTSLPPNQDGKDLPFGDGEKLTYTVRYKWTAINTEVGKFTIETQRKSDSSGEYFHSKSKGITFKFYDIFFKVRDFYESKFTTDLRPIYFHRNIREGKFTMKNDIHFLQDDNINAVYERMSRPAKDTLLKGNDKTFDLITLIFQMRNFDFTADTSGRRWSRYLVIDGKIIEISLLYKGKRVKEVYGIGKYNTLLISVQMPTSESFKGGEEMLIWITDDKNRIPLQVESPIKVGSIVARLTEAKRLIHPLTSRIK